MIKRKRIKAILETLYIIVNGYTNGRSISRIYKDELRGIEIYNKNYTDLKNGKHTIKLCCNNCINCGYNGECRIRKVYINYSERGYLYCKAHSLDIKELAIKYANIEIAEEDRANRRIEKENIIKMYGEIERHEC